MDAFFPLKMTRKKSTQPPWLDKATQKKIKRRNTIYVKEGKSQLWHAMKKKIKQTIEERKSKFMVKKKEQLTDPDANRRFFKLVKSFSTPEKPQTFDVRSLRPGASNFESRRTSPTSSIGSRLSSIHCQPSRSRPRPPVPSRGWNSMKWRAGFAASASLNRWSAVIFSRIW